MFSRLCRDDEIVPKNWSGIRQAGVRCAANAVIVLANMNLGGCGDAGSKGADLPADRPVLVQRVHFAAQIEPRTLVAVIRPRTESDLSFRVAGKVTRRLVDAGQEVRAGEPLAILDATDFQLQREQADAEVRAARSVLDQASADRKRGLELHLARVQPEATYERQRATEDQANWRLVRAERALDLANHALAYSTLAAETDGVITAALVEPGQVVAVGQTVMRIARLDEKEALVDIPEPLLHLAHASGAYLTLWTKPDRHYAVRLRELAPAADLVTRTYSARFSLLEPNPDVAFGMSASVTLPGPAGPKVARLPLSALVNTGTGPGLWSVGSDGELAFRPAHILRYDSTFLLVLSGVAEGERVVALGAQKLDAAQRVRVLNEISP